MPEINTALKKMKKLSIKLKYIGPKIKYEEINEL